MKLFLGLTPIVLAAHVAFAAPVEYELSSETQMGGAEHFSFSLQYTMGTHKGHALEAIGRLRSENGALDTLRGSLEIPIDSMRTGNTTRDCHLREALGLNYQLSAFPAEHVCSSDDAIPATGRDSVSYPSIQFSIKSVEPVAGGLNIGQVQQYHVIGTWKIHGVERKTSILVMAEPMDPDLDAIRIISEFTLNLSDFEVTVKPAKILGFPITVRDQVTVQINLKLTKRS